MGLRCGKRCSISLAAGFWLERASNAEDKLLGIIGFASCSSNLQFAQPLGRFG